MMKNILLLGFLALGFNVLSQPVMVTSPSGVNITTNLCVSVDSVLVSVQNTGTSSLKFNSFEGISFPERQFDTVYVANYSGDNISCINTASGAIVSTLPAGDGPERVTVSPDGKELYVSNINSDNVYIFNTKSNVLTKILNSINYPGGVGFSPDGLYAYIPARYDSRIYKIDRTSQLIVDTIFGLDEPRDIKVTKDGDRLLVADDDFGFVMYSLSGDSIVTMMDPWSGAHTIDISPDGRYAIMSEEWNYWVLVYDIENSVVVARVAGISRPTGVDVDPDGIHVWITSIDNGGLYKMNIATQQIVEIRTNSLWIGMYGVTSASNLSLMYMTNDWDASNSIVRLNTNTEISSTYNVSSGSRGLSNGEKGVWWMNPEKNYGTVANSSTNSFHWYFNSDGLVNGNYSSNIFISGDDPGNLWDTIPVSFTVNGLPLLNVKETCLNFNTQFQFDSILKYVYVVNSGCDTLHITSIISGNSDFYSEFSSLTVSPYDSVKLKVYFTPQSINSYSTDLVFASDGGPDTVCLTGTSIAPPTVSYTPDSLLISLGCEETINDTVVIYNTGSDTLDYFVQNSPSTSQIVFSDNFEDGNYNGWTENSASYSYQVTDTLGASSLNSVILTGGNFNYYDGLSANFSPSTPNYASWWVYSPASNEGFWSNGMAIGDNSTSFNGGIMDFWIDNNGGPTIRVWQGGGNPSVSHNINYNEWAFIELRNIDFVNKSLDLYVDDILVYQDFIFQYGNTVNFSEIHLFSWDPNTTSIFDEIVFGNRGEWLTVLNNNAGSVPSGDSVKVPLSISSVGFYEGIYAANLNILNNDPLSQNINIYAELTVLGDPELNLSNSCLIMDTVLQYSNSQKTFKVYNKGCDTLKVSSISTSTSDFTVDTSNAVILPFDSLLVTVIMNSSIAGDKLDTIAILNNDVDSFICLSGFVAPAGLISLDPDSVDITINGCSDTVSSSFMIYNSGGGDLNYSFENTSRRVGGPDTYFYEDFETGLSRWTSMGGSYPTVLSDDSWEGSNSLEIQGGSYSYYDGIEVKFPSVQTDRISFRIKLNSNLYWGAYMLIGDNPTNFTTGTAMYFLMRGNQNIYMNYGDYYFGYQPEQWYNIEFLNINYTSKNFDFYVDGNFYGTISFRDGSVDQINTIQIFGYDNNLITNYDAIEVGASPDFQLLQSTPLNGTISSGDSTLVNLSFSSTQFPAGTYSDTIWVSSNDPTEPFIPFNYDVTIIGSPQMTIMDTCHVFDTIMEFITLADSLLIKNTGCDSLIFSTITNSTSHFTIAESNMSISAYDSTWLHFSFTPQSSGDHLDTIDLTGNDGDFEFCLSGFAVSSPNINYLPDSLIQVLNTCSDTIYETLMIWNTGLGDLDYNIYPLAPFDSTSLTYYTATGQSTFHNFSNVPNFADSIIITVTLNGDYTNYTSEYADLIIEGINFGKVNLSSFSDGTDYTRVYTFYSPQIDPWLADGILNIELDNSNGVNPGYGQQKNQVRLETLSSEWYFMDITSGTLIPGDTAFITVGYASTGLITGVYNHNIPIVTNDPDSLQFSLPAQLTLNGSPELALSDVCFDFDTVFRLDVGKDTLTVFNNGCDTLWVSSSSVLTSHFTLDTASFYVPPYNYFKTAVSYYPTISGTILDTIHILNNDIDTFVCLKIEALDEPIININPDTLNILLTSCTDTVSDSLFIFNTGGNDLGFYITESTWDSTSTQYFVTSDQQTDHVFTLDAPVDSFYLTVTINGDFRYSYESVDLYIDGDFIETINDGDVTAGTTLSFNYAFGGSTVQNWSSDNNIIVSLDNSYWVAYYSSYLNLHQVEMSVPGKTFFNVDSISSDTIAPFDTSWVFYNIYPGDLVSGNYFFDLIVSSNDPVNSTLTIPVNITMDGLPILSVNQPCLDLDSIMEFTTSDDTLWVYNYGCDTLFIDSMNFSHSAFSSDTSFSYISPNDSARIVTIFSPQSAGVFNHSLMIYTNDVDTTICLNGQAYLSPYMSIVPDSLIFNFSACADSALDSILIINTGGSELIIQNSEYLVTYKNASLDSVLARFNRNYLQVTSMIPNRYDFIDGASSYYIWDGGLDMFDGANYVHTNYQNYIYYSENLVIPSTAFGPTGKFFTKKVNGMWMLAADLDNVSQYRIDGNLGADGVGISDGITMTWDYGDLQYKGFVNRIYNGNVPSINNITIVESMGPEYHNYNTNTNNENHQIYGIQNHKRLYSFLYAGNPGTLINDSVTFQIMKQFIKALSGPPEWLEENLVSDTIQPGDTSYLHINVNSSGLPVGSYETTAVIHSNDPMNPSDSVVIILNLTGSPEIALSEACLDFDTIMEFTSSQLSFWMYNNGCDTLWVDSLTNVLSAYSANANGMMILPFDSQMVTITYAPVTNADFLDTLLIFNNDIDTFVCLEGYTFPRPVLTTLTTTLNYNFTTCNDTIRDTIFAVNNGLGDLNTFLSSAGNSLHLDGNGDYLALGTPGHYALGGTNNFTFEMWVNPDTLNQSMTLLSRYNGGVEGSYYVTLSGGANKTISFLREAWPYTLNSIGTIPANQYSHIAVSFDGASSRIFINGVEDNSMAIGWASYAWSTQILIGAYYSSNSPVNFYKGQLDEIKMWNVAKSSAQIQADMYNKINPTSPNLIGYWDFDNTMNDLSIYSVTPVVNGESYIDVTNAPLISPHISIVNSTDTAITLDSIMHLIEVTSTGLITGNYIDTLWLCSNDPINVCDTVVINVSFIGYPIISAPNCLDLDSIMEFTFSTDTSYIHNLGCDTLFIDSIVNQLAEYTFWFETDTILPGDSSELILYFGPLNSGLYLDTLIVYNNDQDTTICISGEAFESPLFSFYPDSILLTITACTDTVLDSIQIVNSGLGELVFSQQLDYALDFNGSSDKVEIYETTAFDVNDFTYSAWVNPRSMSGWRTIMDIDNDEQLLAILNGNYYLYGRCGTINLGVASGDWEHVTWTVSGAVYKFYVNGVLRATGSSCSAGANANRLMIGSGYSLNELWDGLIKDVSFWSRALDSTEVLGMMVNSFNISDPSLLGYWGFSEGQGTVLGDETSVTYDGVITGATWFQMDTLLGAWVELIDVPDTVLTLDTSTAFINLYTFNITPGDTMSTYLVVESNDPNNPSDSLFVQVIKLNYPLMPGVSDTAICFGQSTPDLIATGIGIQWYDDQLLTNLVFSGDTFPTGQTAVGNYTYYATQTINNCEGPADTIRLNINNSPVPPVVNDTAICFGQPTPDLEANGTNIQWYDDGALTNNVFDGNTFITGITAAGTYTFYLTDSLSGCPAGISDTVVMTINSLPTLPVVTDTTFCFGQSTPDLIASGGDSLHWYDDAALTNLVYVGDTFASGETAVAVYTYYVTVVDKITFCESIPDTSIMEIQNAPTAPAASNQSICDGEAVPDLSASGANIQWYDDAGLSNLVFSGNPYATGQTAIGTYTYYATQSIIAGCESPSSTVVISINGIPAKPTALDTVICENETVPLLTSTGTGIQWYDDGTLTNLVGSGSSFSTGATSAGTFTYYATQTVSACESPADTSLLVINALPTTPIENDTSICFASSTPDLIFNGNQVEWFDDGPLTNLVFAGDTFITGHTAVGNYTYYVTQTQNNCQSISDTIVLSINNTPPTPTANDTSVCFGVSTPDLTATGTNVNWYDDAGLNNQVNSGNSFTTGNTSSSVYTYYVTDSLAGCPSSGSTTVVLTINALPSTPLIGDSAICSGSPSPDMILDTDSTRWYELISGSPVYTASGDTFNPGLSLAGTYVYFASETSTITGCESILDTFEITIDSVGVPTSLDTTICFGNTTPDLTTTGSNARWFDDAGLTNLVNSGNTFTTGITASGTYTYYVTDSISGCTGIPDTSVLVINPIPLAPVSNDTSNCEGSPTPDLSATGSNVLWYDDSGLTNQVGSGGTFITSKTIPGTYVYYATQTVLNCESPATTVTLTINPIPGKPSSYDTTICFGSSTPDLIATGTGISWYDDAGLTNLVGSGGSYSTGQTAIGVYSYYATQTLNGCEGPDTLVILTINGIPAAPSSSDTSICEGNPTPDLVASGAILQWYNDAGLTNNVANGSPFSPGVTSPSTYTYYVTDSVEACPQSASTTVTLTINPTPNQPTVSDVSVCSGDPTPDLSAGGSGINWYSDGALTTLVNSGNTYSTGITLAGSYSFYVTQTSASCTGSSDTITLTIDSTFAPVAFDEQACFGQTIPGLTATGTNLKWYDDQTLSTLIFSGDTLNTGQTSVGNYTYYVTQTLNGCESVPDSSFLTINPEPIAPVSNDTLICIGQTVPDLNASGTNVLWFDDAVLSNQVNSGNTYSTGNTLGGVYTYYIIDNALGCNSDTITSVLTIIDPAEPVSSDEYACFGETTPDLISSGANIQWYDDGALTNLVSSNDTFATGQTAVGVYTYYVTQTISGCESPADTVVLTISNSPGAPSVSDTSACFGSPIPDLTAIGSFLQWYDDAGLTNLIYTGDTLASGMTNAGTYMFYVTDSFPGCLEGAASTLTLTIKSLPSQPTALDTAICFGDTTPDLIFNGTAVQWFDDAGLTNLIGTGDTLNSGETVINSYTYYLTQTINGCQGPSDTVIMDIYGIPGVPVGLDTTICSNETTPVLTASGTSLVWYDDMGLTNQVATGNSYSSGISGAGTYTHYITSEVNGCSSAVDSSVLVINMVPSPPVSSDTTVCEDVSIPDLSSTGSNINWYDNNTLSNNVGSGASFSTGETLPGVYTFYSTQTINSCESSSDSTTLVINAVPSKPTVLDTVICEVDVVPDMVSTGTGISWYDDGALSNLVNSGNTFSTGVVGPGTYTWYVTQTINNCVSIADTGTLLINFTPVEPIGSDTSLCEGLTVPDLTSTGVTVQWYSDVTLTTLLGTGNNLNTGQTSAGTYVYYNTQTVNGCESPADTSELIIYNLPTSNIGNDTAVCFGLPTPDLFASGTNIQWFDDILMTNLVGTGSTYSTGQNSVGNYPYYVTQTNITTGCTSTGDTLTLFINSAPGAPLSSDTSVCEYLNIPDLTAMGTLIQWYDNPALTNLVGTGANYSTGQTTPGTFTYYVTDSTSACPESGSTAVNLTIFAAPLPPSAADTAICFGSSNPAILASGSGIQWYDDPGLSNNVGSGATFTSSETNVGSYEYFITQTETVNGCTGLADSVTFVINGIPAAPISSDTTVCFGQTVPDLAATGSSVLWYSDPALTANVGSGNSYTTGQSLAGTYEFYVTQTINNCASLADTSTLEIIALPSAPVSNDTSSCFGQQVPDLLSSGVNQSWYNDAGLNTQVGSGNVYSSGVSSPGNYTFFVTQTVNGCEGPEDSATVTIVSLPSAPLGLDTSVCETEIIPDLSASGSNILWYSDGALTTLVSTGSSFSTGLTVVGVYDYFVTQSANGCEGVADTSTLEIRLTPSITTVANSAICEGSPTPVLNSTGFNPIWTDAGNNILFVGNAFSSSETTTGTYVYTVYDSLNGCVGPSVSTSLFIHPVPSAPPAQDQGVCFGNSVPDLTANGDSVMWYDNSVLVFNGDTFTSGQNSIGVYVYTVSQTIMGCQSPVDTVVLEILTTPSAPSSSNDSSCFGFPTPDLSTSGFNVSWFDDSLLTNEVNTGSSFSTGITNTGSYLFYIRDTLSGCTSPVSQVSLTIHPIPSAPVGNDVVACESRTINDFTATGQNLNWYDNDSLTNLLYSGQAFNSGDTLLGTYQYFVTQTVLGCQSPADSVELEILLTPAIPLTLDTAVCENQTIPDLTASGSNVKWYMDSMLTNIVNTGNVFITGQNTPGTYMYFVVDSLPGCASDQATSTLNIYSIPSAPITSDTAICFGETVPDLYAEGQGVTWYSEPLLVIEQDTGDYLSTGKTQVGKYSFYATQTINGCEGPANSSTLLINPNPLVTLNTYAVTILAGDSAKLQAFNCVSYSWSPGNGLSQTTGSLVWASPSTQTVYTVTGMNGYGCSSDTSVTVSIEGVGINTKPMVNNDVFNLWPNPARSTVTLDLRNVLSKVESIILLDALGQDVFVDDEVFTNSDLREYGLQSLDAGMYYVVIKTISGQLIKPLIIQ